MWHVKTSPHEDLLRAKYELSTQIKSIKKWTISGQNQQTIAHTRQSDATAITFHKNVRTRLVSESASRLIINLNTAMNFSRQLYPYNWKRVQEKKTFQFRTKHDFKEREKLSHASPKQLSLPPFSPFPPFPPPPRRHIFSA